MNPYQKKALLAGVAIFVGYIGLCIVASKVGDHYFPPERFM